MVFSSSRIAACLAAVCLSSGMLFLSGCDDCDDCDHHEHVSCAVEESCPYSSTRTVYSEPVQTTYVAPAPAPVQQPVAVEQQSLQQPQTMQYDSSGNQYPNTQQTVRTTTTETVNSTGPVESTTRSATGAANNAVQGATNTAGSAVRGATDAAGSAVHGAGDAVRGVGRGLGF